MKPRFFGLFLVLGMCASAASTQERPISVPPPNAANGPIYITHVNIIDTDTGKEAPDSTVVIVGDRISEVKDSKKLKLSAGTKVVNGASKYLIPGLWDMHVHAFTFTEGSTGSVTAMPPEMYFRLAIANGVTGFRDMGGPETSAELVKLRQVGGDSTSPVPKLFAAGPVLDGPKPTWPQHSLSVKNEQEGREAVRKIKSGGFDFVKVYNGVPREAYWGIVQEAREQGISFVGHVPLSISALQASSAGQKSIEHFSRVLTGCSSQENEIDAMFQDAITKGQPIFPLIAKAQQIQLSTYDTSKAKALFETFAKNQTWQVPTFVQQRSFAYLDDKQFRTDPRLVYIPAEVQKSWDPQTDSRMKWLTPDDWKRAKQIYDKSFDIAREMHRQGVRFLAGTDLVNAYIFPGFSLHDELTLLVKAGLSNLEALQAATWNAALFMNASDKYGSVAPGKIADLVLLDADPLKDIHNTTRISEVFSSGKEFDRAALDKVLRYAEAAAKPATSR
jgi:imidazolonepropionase-like amidohydrolase